MVGCSHASPGCDNCYAEVMAARLVAMARDDAKAGRNPGRKARYRAVVTGARWNGTVDVLPAAEWGREPWARSDAAPRRIFVGSMTDVFHPAAPAGFLPEYLSFVGRFPQHLFLFLTKRPERAARAGLRWPGNCALGATVETAAQLPRLAALRRSGCARLFASFEPLIGPVSPEAKDLAALEQAIVGAESGPFRRPLDLRWVRDLRDRCAAVGVPFFYKKGPGDHGPGLESMPLLDGRVHAEYSKIVGGNG
jgi:protein gp37